MHFNDFRTSHIEEMTAFKKGARVM